MTSTPWAIKKARHLQAGGVGPVNPHSGTPYRRLRQQVLAEETHCYLCGRPVDKTLPWNPRHPHPGYPSLHLLHPLSFGGPVVRPNARLAHFRCNQRAGNRATSRELRTSQPW